MSETCTAKINDKSYTVGLLCAICNQVIPLTDVRTNIFPVCEECRRRAKNILYPKEET